MRIILEISWILTKLITYSATSYKLNLKSSSWHTIGSGELLTPHDETPSNFCDSSCPKWGEKKKKEQMLRGTMLSGELCWFFCLFFWFNSLLFYPLFCALRSWKYLPGLPCSVASGCVWPMGGNKMSMGNWLFIHSAYFLSAELVFSSSCVPLSTATAPLPTATATTSQSSLKICRRPPLASPWYLQHSLLLLLTVSITL